MYPWPPASYHRLSTPKTERPCHTRAPHRLLNRVLEWLEAGETSLLAEWLELIKVDPLPALGFAAMAAVSLLALTPLGWLATSMLR